MSATIDYRSDLYKVLQLVSAVKKTSGGVERNISKIYKGAELIWPKEGVGSDICFVCCNWRDSGPFEHFNVLEKGGCDSIYDWRSLPDIYEQTAVVTDAAYILNEYWSADDDWHQATDPCSGKKYCMFAETTIHTVLGYFGRVYLNEGETWRIWGCNDDMKILRIETTEGAAPVEVYYDGIAGTLMNHSYTATRTGWHNFQFIVGNQGGAAGNPSSRWKLRFYLTTGGVEYGPYRIGNIDCKSEPNVGKRYTLPTTWTTPFYHVLATVNPTGGGTVTGTGLMFPKDSMFDLQAYPSVGYTFDHWEQDGVTVGTTTRLTGIVTSDLDFVAVFKPNKNIVCVLWKDNHICQGGNLNCTTATGLNKLADWRSMPELYRTEPVETDAAYILDESWTADHSATDPYSGMQYNMWTHDTTYPYSTKKFTPLNYHTVLGYYGRILLNEGETLTMSGIYDDSLYFRIQSEVTNGLKQVYFHYATSQPWSHSGLTYTATRSGWHEFQLLVGNRGGLSGPASGTATNPSGTGLRFYIKTADEVTHGPFRVGNIDCVKDSAIGERFCLPTAWLDPELHTLWATCDPFDAGTVEGTGTGFRDGDTATLVVTPNGTYDFLQWWDSNKEKVGENLTLPVTIDGDMSFVARFNIPKYEVTTEAIPPEGGTVSGAGVYDKGEEFAVYADTNPYYTFNYWRRGHGTYMNGVPAWVLTAGDAQSNHIRAYFTPTKTFAVTTSIGSGSGSCTGAGEYSYNVNHTVTATPADGYKFDHWVVDGTTTETDNPLTKPTTKDVTYEAHFSLIPVYYSISGIVTPSGTGTVTGGGQTISGGTWSMTAVPNTDYEFQGWYRDEACTILYSDLYTISGVATGHLTLYAKFVPVPYKVTFYVSKTKIVSYEGTAPIQTIYVNAGEVPSANTPVQTGLRFAGWLPLDDTMVAYGQPIYKDTVYFATWEADFNMYMSTAQQFPIGSNPSFSLTPIDTPWTKDVDVFDAEVRGVVVSTGSDDNDGVYHNASPTHKIQMQLYQVDSSNTMVSMISTHDVTCVGTEITKPSGSCTMGSDVVSTSDTPKVRLKVTSLTSCTAKWQIRNVMYTLTLY